MLVLAVLEVLGASFWVVLGQHLQHYDNHRSTIASVKTVAIIGASTNRRKFGNKALRAFAHQGFTVIPINPHEAAIEGYTCYASVLDVPGPLDMATVYVPAHIGVRVMEDIAKKGIPEVWLNPGADGGEVVEKARELGIRPTLACSIIGIGESPGEY